MATKRSIRDEIVACGKDPVYFIRKYVKIQHPVRGLIPFILFDYQEELVRDLQKNRLNVVLKARQLGISEIVSAFVLWMILFRRDKNVVIMASKLDTAKNMIRKIRVGLAKLPKWLVLANEQADNVLSVELDNGSRVKAITTAHDAGRSEAISLLVCDEAAFIPGFEDLWTGLYPTISAGGRAIVMSTPNGVGNKFHQIYVDAETKENNFKPTRLMWWRHPERISDLEDDPLRPGFKTSSWFRKEIKDAKMSPRDVAQELECDFLASGETVISAERIAQLSLGVLVPQSMELQDRALHVWHESITGDQYMVSADVARGDGRDYSAFHVWNLRNMHQVAEYFAKVPPDDFASSLDKIGRRYNNALLVVENNSVGLACLEHIKLLKYPNTYYSRKGDQKAGEAVDTAHFVEQDLVPGFTTSPKNRLLMVTKLEEYLRTGAMVPRSSRFISQLRTFVWTNGRPEGARNTSDDLVMAAAIGAWVRETFLGPNFVTTAVTRTLLGGITRTETRNTDIEGACKDPAHVPRSPRRVDPREQLTARLPHGLSVDMSWVISRG